MAASELGDIYAIREACIVCLYTQFEFSPIGFQALARTLDLGLLQDRGGVKAGTYGDYVEFWIDSDSVVVQACRFSLQACSEDCQQQPDKDCNRRLRR